MGTSKKPNGFGVPTNASLAGLLSEQATPGSAANLILRTGAIAPALRAMGEDVIAAEFADIAEEIARIQAETKAAQEKIETYLTMTGTKTFEEFEAWYATATKHEAELPALQAQVEAQQENVSSVEMDRLKRKLASTEGELRAKKGELARAWGEVINLEERLRLALAAAAATEATASREVRQAKIDALLTEYESWGRITPAQRSGVAEEIAKRFGNDLEKATSHLREYYAESRVNTGRAAAHRSVKARASGALEMTPAQLHELHDEDPDAFELAMQERREARGEV